MELPVSSANPAAPAARIPCVGPSGRGEASVVGWESSRAGAGSSRREREGGGVCAQLGKTANVMRSKLQRGGDGNGCFSKKKKDKKRDLVNNGCSEV